MKGLFATDIVVWHSGVGMGLYGVKSLTSPISSEPGSPASSDPMTSISPTSTNGALGSRVGTSGGQPCHLRLRPCARPG